MGSEQSTKSTETRVMETANFDFRDKPRRKIRSIGTSDSQNNHMSTKKSSDFQEIDKPTNIHKRHDRISHPWLDVGMDVLNIIEKGSRPNM